MKHHECNTPALSASRGRRALTAGGRRAQDHMSTRTVRVATRYKRRATGRSSIRGPASARRSRTPLSRRQPRSIRGQSRRRAQGEALVFPFYSERVSEAVAVIGRTLRDLHRSNRNEAGAASRSASHFSELGGWCRPGTSGKNFNDIRIWPIPLLLRFLNGQDLIDGDIFQNLPQAARPEDFDPLNRLGLAQSEMKADIVAAEIAGDVVDLFDLPFV